MAYIMYFILTIAILVFVHELGHFLAAKISGMRAEVFAIGFGKRLLGWNGVNGFTFGDLPKDFEGGDHTDYRLCLLPLGGYVKIAGMVDESFDTKFANKEPEPYEFRARPVFQKIFVITAGVMMNLTLAVAIFWGINFFQGKQVIKTTSLGYIEEESAVEQAGFESYDEVVAINGQKVNNWEDIFSKMFLENIGYNLEVVVLRHGETVELTIPGNLISESIQEKFALSYGNTRPYIADVLENSPAQDAGIQPGDIFLSLDNVALLNSKEATKIISTHSEVEMPLLILRGEDTVRTTVTPGMEGQIGVMISDIYTGPVEYSTYGFFGSLVQSVYNIGQYTLLTFEMLKNVIQGNVAFNQVFGGPVKIAQFAADSADRGIINFLQFLALLSLSLAIINILPFPVLDGGHFVIIIIEAIARRELPLKVKIAIQNTGFVLLLLLMAFIIYNDIISL